MQSERSPRFKLIAPVVFSWRSSFRACTVVRGLTRDVSVEGVFVQSSECPPADAVVRFHVLFPSVSSEGPGERTMMTAVGRVQRVERSGSGSGFAIETRKMMLSSGGRDEDWWAEGVIKRLSESRRRSIVSQTSGE